MRGAGVLETLAEIAVTFAGFSSLVVVFRHRGVRDWLPQELSTLWNMVGASLACLFFALLPLALELLGLPASWVWRCASLLLAVGMVAGLWATRRDDERLRGRGFPALRPGLSRFREPALGAVTLGLLVNAVLVAGPGLYVVGLIGLLGHAAAGLLYFLSFVGREARPAGEGATARICVRRLVPAAPAAVFAAFTRPDEIRRWHVPGPDFHVCIAEVDLRPGGQYRIGMQPPDREAPHTFYGVYREITAPHRLVYTSNWEPPDRDTGETLVTVELAAHEGATEVVVTHEGLPDQQSADDHTRGWTGTLESLARHFAAGTGGGA